MVQEQLNVIFGFCSELKGGLLGGEAASIGSVHVCAERDESMIVFSSTLEP